MAAAIIGGLLNKNYSPALIRVIESDSKKRLVIENKFKVSSMAEFKKIDKDVLKITGISSGIEVLAIEKPDGEDGE